MLDKYIKINNETMPNPVPGTFEMQVNPDENIFTNEAGEQLINIKRLDRVSWAATFQCTSRLKDKIMEFVIYPQVTVHIDGTQYRGRLRLSSAISLYEWSEYTPGTQGLWTVPVVFEGF